MVHSLSNLRSPIGSRRRSRRLGRGHGSGRGKTAGRGTKGQKARTGGRNKLKRLGMRRMLLQQPKLRGFRSLQPKPSIVNLGDVARVCAAGASVTPAALIAHGLIRSSRDGVKVLGGGECTKALTFKGLSVSAPAKAKIEAAGGSVEPQANSRKPQA